MANNLGRQLDRAVRPFDPEAIARRAIADSRPSILRMTAVAAVFALAAVTGVAAVQGLTAVRSQLGSPAGSQPSAAPAASPADEVTKGPVPESARRPDGTIDLSQVPDFIPALDGDEQVGWIARDDAFPAEGRERPEQIEVYGDDLRTVIGHHIAGRGFVPLGVDPSTVDQVDIRTEAEEPPAETP